MLQEGRDAIEGDPADVPPVRDARGRDTLQLAAILVTPLFADGADGTCGNPGYTLANRRSATGAEPGRPNPTPFTTHCGSSRARGAPTLPLQPATLSQTHPIHPILRSREATVRRASPARAGLPAHGVPAQVAGAPRQWKNVFR